MDESPNEICQNCSVSSIEIFLYNDTFTLASDSENGTYINKFYFYKVSGFIVDFSYEIRTSFAYMSTLVQLKK